MAEQPNTQHAASLAVIQKHLEQACPEAWLQLKQQAEDIGMSEQELLVFAQSLNDYLITKETTKPE